MLVWLLLTKEIMNTRVHRNEILQTVGTTNIETYHRHGLSVRQVRIRNSVIVMPHISSFGLEREQNTTLTVFDQSSPVKLTVG